MCLCVQLYAKVAHLLASPVKMTHLWTGSCVCVCVCVCECEDGTSVIVSCRDNSSLDRQLFVMLCMCIFPFKTCYMKCVRGLLYMHM